MIKMKVTRLDKAENNTPDKVHSVPFQNTI